MTRRSEDEVEMPEEGENADDDTENEDKQLRWWTRQQAAGELRLSIASIRRMEELGTLRPVLRRGVNFFDSREVQALARKRASVSPSSFVRAGASLPERAMFRPSDGQEAAEVFQLLNQNKGLRDIVIEACIPPARVRSLYREWCLSLEDGERLRNSPPEASTQPRRRGRPPKIALEHEYELPPSDEPSDGVPLPDLGILAAAAERLFDDKG